jgi:uncharacterized protein YndB with AHSA1/START domain
VAENVLDAEIRHATFVRAPRERVFEAMTTPEHLDGWFTTGAEVDLRPGGTIHWRWRDWGPDRVTGDDAAPIDEVSSPERLVFRWHGQGGDRLTTVELDFEEADGGTVVRVRETGYLDTPEGRAGFANCAAGWGEALTLVKFYVESGMTYR